MHRLYANRAQCILKLASEASRGEEGGGVAKGGEGAGAEEEELLRWAEEDAGYPPSSSHPELPLPNSQP